VTVVGVSGAAGRMGRLVVEALVQADDLEVGGLYDPFGAGLEIAGTTVSDDPAVIDGVDVVVEFTRPDVVIGNLALWQSSGAHAVVGTSGFDAARIEIVRAMWKGGPPNCLVVSNFSIGAVLMMRLSELAAQHFESAEVVELHHNQKADAPSGTSLETARRIAAAARWEQGKGSDSEELVAGARGSDVDGVRVHSVRLPGLVAHQRVVFGRAGETLSISHDTFDRTSFMPGVLLGIRSVAGMVEPVTVGLEPLLGI
jgi:4-hydroxy-tetrahydrodipicolinate reductase